jgi:transposase InsO family protein
MVASRRVPERALVLVAGRRRAKIEAWRRLYNESRPHPGLDGANEYAAEAGQLTKATCHTSR